MTAAGMLAAASKSLGLVGRPNYVTRDYAKRHGAEFLDAPWCDMSITYWARVSGNTRAVLPDGDRAYTVWHAEDGRDMGRWFPGTTANIKAHAKPGAVIFFDWDGTDIIGRIDHVGLVEKVLPDGRVQTIEGNTGDACKRRIRGASVIAGFWNPPYAAPAEPSKPAAAKTKPKPVKPKPAPDPLETILRKFPHLKIGDGAKDGDPLKWDVKTVHKLLEARDCANLDGIDDTEYTQAHADGVRAVQQDHGLPETGRPDYKTLAALLRIL